MTEDSSSLKTRSEEWNKTEKMNLSIFKSDILVVAAGGCLNSTTGVVIKFYYNICMKQIMILSSYADEEH